METESEAQSAVKNLMPNEVIVSKSGLVFGRNWCKLPASESNLPSIIVQNSNIKKLKKDIGVIDSRLLSLEQDRENRTKIHGLADD